MKQVLEARLEELKREYQKGEERMAVLNQEVTLLNNSMLMITGAIQVTEEFISNKKSEAPITGLLPSDPINNVKN